MVEEGFAKAARVPGYYIAGKPGTHAGDREFESRRRHKKFDSPPQEGIIKTYEKINSISFSSFYYY